MPIHSGPHNISSFKKGLAWKIIISCLILVAIGGINTFWTHLDYKEWFNQLNKPFFSPSPRWIVGVIWTIMYILMGGAVGIIWQLKVKSRYAIIQRFAKQSLWIFVIQVLINAAVPSFFFGLNNLGLVLLGVILNLAIVIFIFRRFFRLDRVAGFLVLPYIVWLAYAMILDIALVILN